MPLIIQKSDGGFNYGTTDMAALRHRVNSLRADRIIYVTDSGQEFHFKLVFAAGLKAGFYDPSTVTLNHMQFGTVMQKNEQGKIERIKSRAGDTVKLSELLDEAKHRALEIFRARLAS